VAQRPAPSEVIVDVEEALELIDKTMERVKSLYEQYFLGIQKQPPTFIHNDLERKLRDLAQVQIRNTALRYRYATLQQKFGSYNSYWRRTLRQIENGTYVRSLAKIGRKALESGTDIPEEILAKMPKRMRDAVRRDREAALALAQRRNQLGDQPVDDGGDFYEEFAPQATPKPRVVDGRGAHLLDEGDADLDLDAFFAQVEAEEENTTAGPPPRPEQFVPTPAPPQPSGPANLRSATLGGMPRAQSPAVRAQTNPGIGPTATRAIDPGDQGGPLGRPPAIAAPPNRATGPVPVVPMPNRATGPVPVVPMPNRATGPVPVVPMPNRVGPPIPTRPSDPAVPRQQTGPMPAIPKPGLPAIPSPGASGAMPAIPRPGFAPSQGVRPNPIAPGASASKQVEVETMQGPFAREPSVAVPPRRTRRDTDLDGLSEATPTAVSVPAARPSQPAPRPTPMPPRPQPPAAAPTRPSAPAARPQRPPPGMTDDDVNSLYAKYVKAKQAVGEATNAQTYHKLLNTINAQAPKIMEQYKAKGVDFSVVVKDNQVIIKAKPKP
jgi:hypothetical protein